MAKKKSTKLKLADLPSGVVNPEVVDVNSAVPMERRQIEQQDRLTVVCNVYHQGCCEDPQSINLKFADFLDTKEQPYWRKLKATTEWQTLDLGWLAKNPGLIVIENKVRLLPSMTDEVKSLVPKRILLLRWEGGTQWIIRPGRFHLGEVGEDVNSRLEVSALTDTVDFTVHVYPR